MTEPQRISLQSRWWPAACRAQGWKPNDRDLRLRVLSLAIHFTFADVVEFRNALEQYDILVRVPLPNGGKFEPVESANDLNSTTHVDAVKTLLLMLNDNLDKANEHGKPEIGQGRRQRNVIEEKILCLSQYPLDQPMGLAGARAFCQEILNDKFNRGRKYQHLSLDDVDDRPRFIENKKTGKLEQRPSQKEQLLMTINARLNGKDGYRAKAGHSVHDMLVNVGLPCTCSRCTRAALARQAVIPAISPISPISPITEPAVPEQDAELEPASVADPELGEGFSTGDQPF